LLLVREENLIFRVEALTLREEKARILEKALTKVSADLNAERAKAEATWKEHLNKMAAHTARTKHSLSLDKMMGKKKVELNKRERDLNLGEAALAEAQTRRLNPRDNCEEMMEVIEL
jgi:oligoendopeptidase F